MKTSQAYSFSRARLFEPFSIVGALLLFFLWPSAPALASSVTSFSLPATSESRLVPVSEFEGTAATEEIYYLINESSDAPAADDANWSATVPSAYLFGGTGERTAYAWVMDGSDTVSASANATVTITPSFDEGDFTDPTPAGLFSHNMGTAEGWPSSPFGGMRLWTQYVSWRDLNPSEGVYDWSALDEWLALAADNDVDVLYTFGRTPHWASLRPDETCSSFGGLGGGGCAAPPSDVDGENQIWKDFVTALVEHSLASAQPIKYYEIWNEPDLGSFWSGTNEQLIRMQRDAYEIIHALDPEALVLGPSPTGTESYEWLDAYYEDGGGEYQDIVTYHPYVGASNVYLMADVIDNIQQVMQTHGIDKPIWGTEGSWGSNTNITTTNRIAWVAKAHLISWMKGVERNYWYRWDGGVWGPLWDSTSGVAAAGTAYTQIYNWLVGSYKPANEPCWQTIDETWHCYLTLENGNPAQIIWNDGGTTVTVNDSYTSYLTLDNSEETALASQEVAIDNEPLLLVVNDIVERKTDAYPAPEVTSFSIRDTATTPSADSAVVPVDIFTARDAHNTVGGYLITESSDEPSADDPDWDVAPPTIFTFSGTGTRTAYAWVKNTDGDISESASQIVTITQADPVNVYYSVGQTEDDLKTGSPTMTITDGEAVFSVAQSGNIGVGDEVLYGATGEIAYIAGKTASDQKHWSLITATGERPADVSAATVTSITRAFTSLSSAVTNATDHDHLDNSNLASLNIILNFPCYYDTGADTAAALIQNTYTTIPTNYINIYTPIDTQGEVNRSQRHAGKWQDEGAYRMTTSAQYAIKIITNYVRVTGIQIEANVLSNFRRTIMLDSLTGSGGYIVIDKNIIKANVTGTPSNAEGIGATSPAAGPTVVITNNVISGYKNSSSSAGIYIKGLGTYYVYNNTVYDSYNGFLSTRNGTTQVPTVSFKNNIAQGNTVGYNITFTTQSGSTNNLSDLSDAPGSNAHNAKTVAFVDAAGGDFHLSVDDTVARDLGADLSEDANYPFTLDVDGETRPYNEAWDIGADEYMPPPPVIIAFSLPATATTLTVPVLSFTATSDLSTITGYLITETSSKPAVNDAGWAATAPTTFTFSSFGSRTAYAWAKNTENNISEGASAAIVLAPPEPEASEEHFDELAVSQVRYQVVEGNKLMITFKTSNNADPRIRYGLDEGLNMEKKGTGKKKKEHVIYLTDLIPGARYYFRIKVEDRYDQIDRSRIHIVDVPSSTLLSSAGTQLGTALPPNTSASPLTSSPETPEITQPSFEAMPVLSQEEATAPSQSVNQSTQEKKGFWAWLKSWFW